MKDLLIRKYIIDIIFTIVVISLLTWFWFGPYQHKVRIKESLMENNISFNKDITYDGFDNLTVSSNKITKDLTVTNDGNKDISFVSNFTNFMKEQNINWDIKELKIDKHGAKILKGE